MENQIKNDETVDPEKLKNLSPEIQDFLTKYPSKPRSEQNDDAKKTPTLW